MIKIKNITKIYNKGQENQFNALQNISLEIKKGELIAIVGKSGAGKSTLLHILGCIDKMDEGEYYLENKLIKDLSESEMAKVRNEKLGIIMQEYALVNDMTAIENVMLPLDFSRRKIKHKKELCEEALNNVDMLEYKNTIVNKLSGGQKQRVAIARAIVNNPSVILADEPTGALDSENSKAIMDIFHTLNSTGVTVIIITHDMEIAKQCNRTIQISDGMIMHGQL